MNVQKINNNNILFSSADKNQFKKLAGIIESNNPKFHNKPEQIAQMYENSINFLNGKLKTKDYLSKLEQTLDAFHNQNNPKYKSTNPLTPKEVAFLENLEITAENNSGLQKLTKKELANHLSILA